MAEEFKRLDRKLVYHGTIIDYYRDTIQVPNGNIAEWDFIGHKGAAAVVPVREDGKLLMVRQWRNALDRYTLEIPAGRIKPAQTSRRCWLPRVSWKEETGYHSENLTHLLSLRTTVAFCNEKIEIYVAQDLKPTHQHLDEDEFIDVYAYSVDELCEMIHSGKIEDGKTIAAIMSYKAKYEKSSAARYCIEAPRGA